jgi:D-inositol-3-phosphate glycosyltransferase
MKIMMFGVELETWYGKTHVHCERYLHLLRLAGCDVTFVEYRGLTPPEIPNVTYRRYPRRYRLFEKALGTRIPYFLRRRSLRSLWRFVRPDICHVQFIDENFWHTARAGLRPLVATAWGSDIISIAELSADDPLRQKFAAALRLVDHLIVDSDDMVPPAERLAGKRLSTTLLPIGINTEQFCPDLFRQRKDWRERLRIDPEAIVLISVRRLGTNYRQSEIIRAFAALDHADRKQTYLIIRTFGLYWSSVGPSSQAVLVAELHRLAERLNVADQIRWIGDVEYTQLPGLYAASDIAINFPIIDSFPVSFLECFACGLPIVSNRLASYQSNGASTYLLFAEDDSVAGLKLAIEAAIERLNQWRNVASEAREHVVQNFDERVTARALRRVYETVLHAKSNQESYVRLDRKTAARSE